MNFRSGIALIIAAYIIFSSLLYLGAPLSPDEGNTLFTSEKFIEGVVPYKDIHTDIKMPGMYYVSYVLLSIANSQLLPRIAAMIVTSLSIIILFYLARRLFDEKTGLIAAAVFMLVSLLPGYNAYMFLADGFVTMFILASAYFFINGYDSTRGVFISGLLAGIAFVFKQVSALIIVFYILFYLLCLRSSTIKIKEAAMRFSTAIVAFLIPVAVVLLHFAYMGGLNDLIYWTVKGSANYSVLFSLGSFLERLTSLQTAYILSTISVLWLMTLVYFLHILHKAVKNRCTVNETFLLSYTISMSLLFATTLSYFVQLIPIMCIFTAAGILRLKGFVIKSSSFVKVFTILFVAALLILSIAVNVYSEINLQKNSFELNREYSSLAGYIQNNTEKSDRIFVFGYLAPVYYLSNRDPPLDLPIYMYPNDEQVNDSDEKAAVAFFKENYVKYMVVDTYQKTKDYNPIIFEYIQTDYSKEYTTGRFDLYRHS